MSGSRNAGIGPLPCRTVRMMYFGGRLRPVRTGPIPRWWQRAQTFAKTSWASRQFETVCACTELPQHITNSATVHRAWRTSRKLLLLFETGNNDCQIAVLARALRRRTHEDELSLSLVKDGSSHLSHDGGCLLV